ncbi:MAG TPA: flavodoxin domain-containing protein [Jatrophihabitans sp.]|nr:flavodoxin domain-containing protein [Jatrophihabitans sp.]
MRTLVVYESIYGNTRQLAEAIADGCRQAGDASAIRLAEANPGSFADLGLLVLGAPTHAWGLSRAGTRKAAVANPAKGSPPAEAAADQPGMRELLAELPRLECPGAAFDTRLKAPGWLTGHAAHGIAHRLRQHGVQVLGRPESFFVTKQNQLRAGELERARAWGVELTERRARLAGSHH